MILGVTGSPGSGKTTVANLLVKHGAVIVDVDLAGKWVADHVIAVRQQIRHEFGADLFDAKGNLDRKRLGTMVFSDRVKLEKLNHIIHPYMINRVRGQIIKYQYRSEYTLIVVDAALLFELSLSREMDQVLVVQADLETRINRVCERHGVSADKARQMTLAQWPQEKKITGANIVLDNSGELSDLEKQVDIIVKQLTEIY